MLNTPRVLIHHAALRHNLEVARRHAPESRIWAVIKADAYGHGMEAVAQTLGRADGFAVARIAEALRLRAAGITRPILVLAGAFGDEECHAAARYGFELALHQPEQLGALARLPPGRPLRVWLKVDTGMHRLGLDPAEVPAVLAALKAYPGVAANPGLMTHLANADDPQDPLSDQQCARLRALAAPDQLLNIGNSGGLLAFPAARTHWVRPGILLYGASPFAAHSALDLGLRPVMTFQARLIDIRQRRRGDRLGYGGTYCCEADMPVGVAAVGYGDGYPRHAPSGTPVLVAGRRARLVGRVSMDSLTLDLRGIPEAVLGAEVVLWGENLPADEIARQAGTISYELFCGVTGRVVRKHLD